MKSHSVFRHRRPVVRNGKLIRRFLSSLGLAFLLSAHSALAQTPTTWIGGSSTWENAAFWDNGIPNSASADAFIDGGKTGVDSVVTMQSSNTVGRLTLDAGDTLDVNSNFTFQAGSFTGSGSVINNGTINNSAANILYVGSASVSGTGTINLLAIGSTFGASLRAANANGDRLTIGVGQTIAGSTSSNNGGSLGGSTSTFTNNGTVNANTSLDSFVIAPGGGNGNDFTNGATGIAEATNGGLLILAGGNFNGGTYQALDGSEVLLSGNLSINNAIFTTAGTGFILLNSGQPTLTGVTNSGTFNVNATNFTIGGGNLTNNGTMTLSGGGTLLFTGNTSFTGTGTINLLAAGTTFGQTIRPTNSGDQLTIGVGQTIAGSTRSNNGGSLGNNESTIINNGTIIANTSLDSFLIEPGSGNKLTNGTTGLVEAINGGIMMLGLGNDGLYTNNGTFAVVSDPTGGSSSFSVVAGALTNFLGDTLTGGTYNLTSSDSTNTSTLTFGGGTIATNAANVTLDGVNTVFDEINGLASNQGSFTVANGRNFTTLSGLANSGTLVATGGSTLSTNGAVTQNGTLVIGLAGAVSVNGGGYTQGSGASFNIELGEDNPAGFQQLTVTGITGIAHLAGALNVALVNGYTPAPGQTFVIVKATAIDGEFDNVTGATVTYTPTEVIITPTPSAPPLTLTSAVSRETHGTAGTFDIDLPLAGQPGVECRYGRGNFTLVFTFSNNVVSGSASVTSGAGSVPGSPIFAGMTMTVNLSGVTDAQTITVTLHNVTDENAQVLPDTNVSAGILLGDTTGDGTVGAGDLTQTKSQSGHAVTVNNFREDVTIDGRINSADIALVKSRSGARLPQ